MHVWALGLSCETPAAPPDRAAGARTRQPENSKRAHLSAPGASNTTKIPRKRPKEREKRKKLWREEGKKSAKFRAPTLLGPTLLGPTMRSPCLRAPTLLGPTMRSPCRWWRHRTRRHSGTHSRPKIPGCWVQWPP